jgi:ABC-type dipeptide/oligopeptide/nickel transport system permease subunit
MFTLTQWGKYGHLSRIQTLYLLKKPYVLDAKYQGFSQIKIIWLYLFPKVRESTSSLLPHTFINYLSVITSLSYFNITLFPDHPALGKLIFYAKQHHDHHNIIIIISLIFGAIGFWLLKQSKAYTYCQH